MKQTDTGKQLTKITLISAPSLLLLLFLSLTLFLSSCASVGKITNPPMQKNTKLKNRYSFVNHVQQQGLGDVLFLLAFSGGGTRAAALSYGVLEELGDTYYQSDTEKLRLLDEIDRISGVSGGSFTAAYYGLFGDQIFETFKNDFLYKDIQGELTNRIYYNFFHFMGRQFTGVSRTEDAIDIYDQYIFKGKTFADLQQSGHPFITINATDLNAHSQFVFTQDFFDFLCSDLSQVRVARAVAASSAGPVLFSPVLMQNYHDCNRMSPSWLVEAEKKASSNNDPRLKDVIDALKYYQNADNPPYATLVDGGVTDNLGLRASLDSLMIFEGTDFLQKFLKEAGNIRHVVVVIVNASTTAVTEIGKSRELPSAGDVFTAVTDIQLHRYNLESSSLLQSKLKNWVQTISSGNEKIDSYFIELSVDDVKDKHDFHFLNKIPTSLTLEQEQVDKIIETARQLLQNDPEYQRLLQNLASSTSPASS